jgi:hypothetical protein
MGSKLGKENYFLSLKQIEKWNYISLYLVSLF